MLPEAARAGEASRRSRCDAAGYARRMQTGADTQTNAAWARALAEGRGLLVLRASRLETLAGHLHVLLAMTRPEGLLAAQTVIAAHPGMRPWILDQLALHAGPGGVVANVDVVLASAWLDALAQARLGQRAVALPGYRRGPLTWTLHELLAPKAAGAVGVRDARVAAYLDAALDATDAAADAATDAVTTMHAEGERARRRHQLAEHLAGLFQQYLVYRPDWLRAWQRGDDRAAKLLSRETSREGAMPFHLPCLFRVGFGVRNFRILGQR